MNQILGTIAALSLAFLPALHAAGPAGRDTVHDGAVTAAAGKPDRPNIVFILADDLGWSDTTLFGTTKFYQTPHLERLAKRGMLFTRAYSASPLCSPTRASILTGQNPARIGITAPNCHLPEVRLAASVRKSAPAASKALECESATRRAENASWMNIPPAVVPSA